MEMRSAAGASALKPRRRKILLVPPALKRKQTEGVSRVFASRGGAPRGNKNALKHGRYTAQNLADNRALWHLTQDA